MVTRAAIVVMLVGLAAPARADMVMGERVVAFGCSEGKTWDAVTSCFAGQQLRMSPVRMEADLHLVELAKAPHYRTLALFVRRGGTWHLGGWYEPFNDTWQLVAFQPLEIKGQHGYKLTIGQAMPVTVPVDLTFVTGLSRFQVSLYCSTKSDACIPVYEWCEVLVRGRAWYAFHGAWRFSTRDPSLLEVTGDNSKTGPSCPHSGEQQINF